MQRHVTPTPQSVLLLLCPRILILQRIVLLFKLGKFLTGLIQLVA